MDGDVREFMKQRIDKVHNETQRKLDDWKQRSTRIPIKGKSDYAHTDFEVCDA